MAVLQKNLNFTEHHRRSPPNYLVLNLIGRNFHRRSIRGRNGGLYTTMARKQFSDRNLNDLLNFFFFRDKKRLVLTQSNVGLNQKITRWNVHFCQGPHKLNLLLGDPNFLLRFP